DVLVGPGLGRQPQDPFRDDVAQDLGGPALDRVALRPQVAVTGVAVGERDDVRPAHGPVAVAQALLTEQLELEAAELLREPGEGQLHRRALRPGPAERELLAQPLSGEPGDLR